MHEILFFKGFPLAYTPPHIKSSTDIESNTKETLPRRCDSPLSTNTTIADSQVFKPPTANKKMPNLSTKDSVPTSPAALYHSTPSYRRTNVLPNILVLGIGANIGSSDKIERTFFHLLTFFIRHHRFCPIRTSPIYKNPPFGYTKQAHFYNATITLHTSLSILEVFGLVFYLERRFGRPRKRLFKNAPRTLDIDIIFYNQLILKRPYLTIPHRSYHTRSSVLLPMLLDSKIAGIVRNTTKQRSEQ